MPSKAQDRPLVPHPLLKAASGRDLSNIAVIEAIVCSSTAGKVELAPDIGSLAVRLTVSERDILSAEPVPGVPARYQLVIAGDADIVLVSTHRLKAAEIDGSDGGFASDVVMMRINDSGGTTGEVNCVTACSRAKRRCEGLFPTQERKERCQKDYDTCIGKCSNAIGGGGGIFIA